MNEVHLIIIKVFKMAKPISSYNVGNVQLSVWENVAGDGVIQSITFQKSYKDLKTGEFKNSTSFKYNELVFLKIAIDEALKDRYLKIKDF